MIIKYLWSSIRRASGNRQMFKQFINSLFIATLITMGSVVANAQSFGGAFEGMSNSKDPIQIEADKLEVMDGQGIAKLRGNVSVVQGTTILKTARLTVYYNKDSSGNANSRIKKIEATGRVAVRSGDQLATADKAVINMNAENVVLTGNVSVSQGANIVEGCVLRVNLKTNAAQLDPCKEQGGRIKMLFTPKSSGN